MFGDTEGPPIETLVFVGERERPIGMVGDLRVVGYNGDSLRLVWDGVPQVTAYRITWRLVDGREEQTRVVRPDVTSYTLDGLREAAVYQLLVSALVGDNEGRPVTITARTQDPSANGRREPVRPRSPSTPVFTACPEAQADLVFLVDGSSSVNVENFRLVKDFLSRVISYLPHIGADGTQVAVIQYSDQPMSEVQLNRYRDQSLLLQAVQAIPFRGGGTLTGHAIQYVLHMIFQSSAGTRPGVPRILVVLTDGQSLDSVERPAQEASASGLTVYAVGVGEANRNELQQIARDPRRVFYANSFEDLIHLEANLSQGICQVAKPVKPEVSKHNAFFKVI
uniref:Uncharacterized protein n=1 Tax=Eptatretus burgeri TaxID=7764 RepID=A0A8C4N459_EPTBU